MKAEKQMQCDRWLTAIAFALISTLLLANLRETYSLGKEVTELRGEVQSVLGVGGR